MAIASDQSYLSVDWQNPINRSHPMGRHRLLWLMNVPSLTRGSTWRDLTGNWEGDFVNLDPTTDWELPDGDTERRGGWGHLRLDRKSVV